VTDEQATIYVVDDDAALRKGLSLSLKERGFDVESHASAASFLDAVDTDRHSCLVLDIRMPQTTGLELQDELIRRGITIPIIFITGHGDIPMTARAMRRGAVDFLEKPYQLSMLLQRIGEALAMDRKARDKACAEYVVRQRFERLTRREAEVMALIVAGASNTTNRAVAQRLGIGPRTVETYRARLMEKMQARSLPELVSMAKICGIYEPDPS